MRVFDVFVRRHFMTALCCVLSVHHAIWSCWLGRRTRCWYEAPHWYSTVFDRRAVLLLTGCYHKTIVIKRRFSRHPYVHCSRQQPPEQLEKGPSKSDTYFAHRLRSSCYCSAIKCRKKCIYYAFLPVDLKYRGLSSGFLPQT